MLTKEAEVDGRPLGWRPGFETVCAPRLVGQVADKFREVRQVLGEDTCVRSSRG